MDRTFFLLGSLSGMLSVMLGAFGAHGLKDRVPADLLTVWETGARYHSYHALALLATAWVVTRWPDARAAGAAGWLFLGGTVLFSGSLYLMTLTGHRWLGAVTPFGGVMLIAGWACLAWVGWRG